MEYTGIIFAVDFLSTPKFSNKIAEEKLIYSRHVHTLRLHPQTFMLNMIYGGRLTSQLLILHHISEW